MTHKASPITIVNYNTRVITKHTTWSPRKKKLPSLSVECKLTKATNLEQESQAWKRIRDSLLVGQLYILYMVNQRNTADNTCG